MTLRLFTNLRTKNAPYDLPAKQEVINLNRVKNTDTCDFHWSTVLITKYSSIPRETTESRISQQPKHGVTTSAPDGWKMNRPRALDRRKIRDIQMFLSSSTL